MLGSVIRRCGLWTVDLLQGGKKRKDCKDIAEGNVHAEERLQAILKYAAEHVPCYRDLSFEGLSDFPVMSKSKYRSMAENEYVSDEYSDEPVHHVYTSGSTGTPFHVIQDAGKRNRVSCDLIYCHDQIGWHVGDHYIFIRNWVSNYKQSKLKNIAQNVYNVNIVKMDDTCKAQLIEHLKNHRKSIIFGYASAVYELTSYVMENQIDGKKLGVKLIVCDSDALSPSMRAKMNKVFNCPVYNRYDNEENGLLGISQANGDRIYLNTASLYFEILKLSSDEAQIPGEIGRLVVTDLFNKAMPLIRYDTGDLAVSNDIDGNIQTIEGLFGRQSGCLSNTSGRLVSDVSISGAVEPFVEIRKYQIQQTNNQYVFMYVGTLDDVCKQDLLNRLETAFGREAVIVLKNVEDIPNGKNGKYRTTINTTDSGGGRYAQ